MKRKTGLSLMMALLMVFSVFTVITPSVLASPCGLYVEKKVRNGEGWDNEVTAYVGDIVEFKITITYYNWTNCASNIVVTDTLPAGLEYEETLEPEDPEPEVTGNTLVWDFGEEQLCHGDSITIRFEAIIVSGNYGENVNTVNVTAEELCGSHDLYGDDDATVIIEPSIDAEKKVWDPDAQEWVDHLDSVIKDVDVQFQITITYYGPDIITCLKVTDTFIAECECGDCLEYINGSADFTYPNMHFGDPEIIVGEDNKSVKFNWWEDILFNLYDGESVVITFEANVTHYCYDEEYNTVTNEVIVEARHCEMCEPLSDIDTATVNCHPHDPVFEKKVWNGEDWVEEATAYVGDYVLFKIELTYYGSYNLSDIQVVDVLPKNILTFYEAIPPSLKEDNVLEDGTKICWNIQDALNDSDTLVIKFSALVIGETGDCDYCGINTASYTANESDTHFEGEDTANVTTTSKPEVALLIDFKTINIGRVNAYITNIGEEDLSDIEWTISAKVGLLGLTKRKASGKIKTLPVGSSATVSTYTNLRSRILRRFGRISVTVSADIDMDSCSMGITVTTKGFVLGRIVILPQPRMPQPL